MTAANDPFDWSGGHPALDFVNTLDERPLSEPIEILTGYGELVRFTELAGLIAPKQARLLRKRSGAGPERVARDARRLREQLFEILAASHRGRKLPPTLRGLTAAINKAHAARLLAGSNGACIISYDWASSHEVELPLHACALVIADLLTGEDRTRIRKCGASDCDVYFIDRSKGHRRHWCSMRNCGNREKQRRWRATAE
jgi:predicted RNA-binding Zn ribbon-like protein